VSVSSQVTGTDEARKGRSTPRYELEDEGGNVDVELVHARWRNLFWGAAGMALGTFFISAFGLFGWVVGGGIALLGVSSMWSFIKTLLWKAGHIAVAEEQVTLTPALCSPTTVVLSLTDLKHAYLLKRAVPWAVSGPLLVVESKEHAWTYPRDWFATESDQRRILAALNRKLGVL
jgi:hypothetical protein